jgi:hypothetical protein
MARTAFVVNDALREKVRHLAGLGIPQDDIAGIVACARRGCATVFAKSSIAAWPRPMR